MTAKDQPGTPCSEEVRLKKGPWTALEDKILTEYVTKHGEGNWNAAQKHSGLFRCGKSCRFRWVNHLRPSLKRGAITQEEENLIIKLHAQMGNKWARMVKYLPGRTDNEIKNYWNTRIKRCQKAGLPIYPPEVTLQAAGDGRQSIATTAKSYREKSNHNLFQSTLSSGFETPDFKLNTVVNPVRLTYRPGFPDVVQGSTLTTGLGFSKYSKLRSLTMHHQQHIRDSRASSPGHFGSANGETPMINQFHDTSGTATESFGLSIPFDSIPSIKNRESTDDNQRSYGHASGNSSTSTPTYKAENFELPSLQYQETVPDWWETSFSPPPLLHSVDSNIEPPLTGAVELNCPSPYNSGLLDALVQQARNRGNRNNNQWYQQSSNLSAINPGDATDGSTKNTHETGSDGVHDPVSSLGHTGTLYGDGTHISAGRSSHEQLPNETISRGCNLILEPTDPESDPTRGQESDPKAGFLCPDALLGLCWSEPVSCFFKNPWCIDRSCGRCSQLRFE